MKMGIVFDELKNGGFVIRESVSETLIGQCWSFAGYIEVMKNNLLDPLDGLDREDFVDAFTSPEDKMLIGLITRTCEDCGERLPDCVCSRRNPDLTWAKQRFPQLFR
jgi:hypothetical protein